MQLHKLHRVESITKHSQEAPIQSPVVFVRRVIDEVEVPAH
jgi:hypothetical protein